MESGKHITQHSWIIIGVECSEMYKIGSYVVITVVHPRSLQNHTDHH